MPGRKKKARMPDGREVEAVEMSFQAASENWNEYLLDDGSVVRMKLVATEVVRVEGEYDPQGQPVYLVQSTNLMVVSAPDNLKRT